MYSATQLQLTHVLQQFFRRVGGKVTLLTGVTGGSETTTAIDTKLVRDLGNSNRDDYYNGGAFIVIEDAGGANAAPEGQVTLISDYVASTTTFTLSPALSSGLASGDRVIICTPDFPLYDVIEQVNDALRTLTETPRFDSSITTVANQTEYTLPVALKGARILKVEVQGITSDSDSNRWRELPRTQWEEWFANAGSTGLLYITQLASGYTIRITYQKWHPRVDAYDDPIDEFYHPDLVHAVVMSQVLQWRNDADRASGTSANPELVALEQKAWSQVDRARVVHPVIVPVMKQIKGFPHWNAGLADDEFKPIPLP